MRFLTGVMTGALGAMNQEMDENRKSKEEWQRTLFKYYTETVIPTYQKFKLDALERSKNAETFGMLFGNQELGNLVANMGVKDGAQAMAIGEKFQLESRRGLAGPTGMTQATPVAPAQVANDTKSSTPVEDRFSTEQSWWDKGMGKPNIGLLSSKVAGDVGQLYGVNADELKNIAHGNLDPTKRYLPVNREGLPQLKATKDETMVKLLTDSAKFSNNPTKFAMAAKRYAVTGDVEAFNEAMSTVPSWQERVKFAASQRTPGSGPDPSTRAGTAMLHEGATMAGNARAAKEPDPAKKRQAFLEGYNDYRREKQALNRFTNEMIQKLDNNPNLEGLVNGE